jgi:hypothetical protein
MHNDEYQEATAKEECAVTQSGGRERHGLSFTARPLVLPPRRSGAFGEGLSKRAVSAPDVIRSGGISFTCFGRRRLLVQYTPYDLLAVQTPKGRLLVKNR